MGLAILAATCNPVPIVQIAQGVGKCFPGFRPETSQGFLVRGLGGIRLHRKYVYGFGVPNKLNLSSRKWT